MWGKASMKAAELRMIENQWFETGVGRGVKQKRAGALSSGPLLDGVVGCF